ncbi:MAG: hypothetical protein ACETVV_02100 [Nitrososphaeria archaeon]
MPQPIISVSGVRGVLGDNLLSDDLVRILQVYSNIVGRAGIIALGRDTRGSGLPIAMLTESALMAMGHDVLDLGVLPTPALVLGVRKLGASSGVMITASHNPPQWNGLKFVNGDGTIFREDQMEQVDAFKSRGAEVFHAPWNQVGRLTKYGFSDQYVKAVLNWLDLERIRRARLLVATDAGGGAAYQTTSMMLSQSGCRVLTLNDVPGVFNRAIEPLPEALTDLKVVVKEIGASFGVAHDCDGDRAVFVNEKAEVLREDLPVAVALDHYLARNKTSLVVNSASSQVFEHVAQKHGVQIYEAPVGEANVVQAMIERRSLAGAEGSNGGLILRKFTPTRDGGLLMMMIVEAVAQEERSLGELISDYPKYFMARRSLALRITPKPGFYRELARLYGLHQSDLRDGLKLKRQHEWIFFRASRTEPILRVMAESKSEQRTEELINEGEKRAKSLLAENQSQDGTPK